MCKHLIPLSLPRFLLFFGVGEAAPVCKSALSASCYDQDYVLQKTASLNGWNGWLASIGSLLIVLLAAILIALLVTLLIVLRLAPHTCKDQNPDIFRRRICRDL